MNFTKFLSFSSLAVSCLFVSCTNNDFSDPANVARSVQVTVSASLGQLDDGMSRSELVEQNGDLEFLWTEGDVVVVTENNTVAGHLTAENAGKWATLNGALTLTEGSHKLNYYFLGHGVPAPATGSSANYILNLSTQSGNAADMRNYGVMTTGGNIEVENGVASAQTINLKHLMTFAHFTLKFPEGTSAAGCTVTVSGDNVCNSASLTYSTATLAGTAGEITVGGPEIYMTLLPASQIGLTFTATDADNNEYVGSLPAVDIKPATYIRSAVGDGTYAGIPVEMSAVAPEVDESVIGPVFEVNGKKFRFTRANLYYDVDNALWYMPENQYEYITKGGWTLSNGTWSKTKESVIDMYGWGATGLLDVQSGETAQAPTFWRNTASQTYGNAHYYYPTPNTSYNNCGTGGYLANTHGFQGMAFDWGTAYERQDGVTGHYFTLSSSDWSKLDAGYFFCGATIYLGNAINSGTAVNGCMIFGVSDKASAVEQMNAAGVSFISSSLSNNLNFSGNNYQYFKYEYVKMTLEEFNKLNVVFLPEAGHKAVETMTSGDGYYWTSTGTSTTNGNFFRFDGDSSPVAFKIDAVGRSLGCAVRLVKEVQE